MDMPPMDMPPMGPESAMPQMGGMDSQNGMDDFQNEVQDDNENGPGSDVKKYSGELSQALNTYNEENPNDEGKLNKYAINMIAAQVANNLSDKDKRSVVKKLRGDMDDMSNDEQPQPKQQEMPMESRVIDEISNELMNDRKPIKRDEKKITNKMVSKRNPFVSNR